MCGASKGIGKQVAFELSKAGANVTLLARSKDVLANLVKELPGEGKHSFISIDVSETSLLKNLIQNHINLYGNIHILVNNTGGPKAGPVSNAQEDDFLDAFKNHVLVNSILSQLVIPGMKKDNFGRIINIISTSVKIPLPNLGVSNTIRGAVASWAKTLSNEVASFGITVNNVLPGYTDTERLKILMENNAKNNNKSISQVEEEWKNSVPMKRFANPTEIANAVLFLASSQASYINGVNLPVDGGRTGCL